MKDRNELQKINLEANNRISSLANVIDKEKDPEALLNLNHINGRLDYNQNGTSRSRKNTLNKFENGFKSTERQGKEINYGVTVGLTPTSSKNDQIYQHQNGDIINRPNGTITSRNYNDPIPSPVDLNGDDDLQLKTDDGFFDKKRGRSIETERVSLNQVHLQDKDEEGVTISNTKQPCCKKYGIIILCLICFFILALFIGFGYWYHTQEIEDTKVDVKEEIEIQQSQMAAPSCPPPPPLTNEECKQQCPVDKSVFTVFPVNCQTDADKCSIEYEKYCTKKVDCAKQPELCKIDYDTHCTKKVDCNQSPEKCEKVDC